MIKNYMYRLWWVFILQKNRHMYTDRKGNTVGRESPWLWIINIMKMYLGRSSKKKKTVLCFQWGLRY